MTGNHYLPHFKDQTASVPAERDPRPRGDPDGQILASSGDASVAAAYFGPVPIMAQPRERNPRASNDILEQSGAIGRIKPTISFRTPTEDHPPAPSSSSPIQLPIAFAVVGVEDDPSDNNEVPRMTNQRNNDSNETTAPKQTDRDPELKQFPWMTAIATVSVIVLVVGGAVVGGVCGSGGCGGDPGTPVQPTPPTASKTSAPTSATPTPTREQNVTNFISLNSYMGVEDLTTGRFPEEQALQWLINDDPLQLNVGDERDELRLLQRYSLLTLWFQGGTGTMWDDSSNWLSAGECTWAGIDCEMGVVTNVDLTDNGLEGTLSPELGLLSNLEDFDLAFNRLVGSLPSQIALWTNLELFTLNSNDLSGPLPLELGSWTNLTYFDISSNGLTGSLPSELGLWTSLTHCNISSNGLSGSLPSEIGLWTNLAQIDVDVNSLTGSLPSQIGFWTSLNYFTAQENSLAGSLPSEIGLWPNLIVFSVKDNSITGSLPSQIGLLTSLTFFSVEKNNLSGSLGTEIGQWTRLEVLSITGNSMTGSLPSGIGLWNNLRLFHVYDNRLTGSLPTVIGLWPSLTSFAARANNFVGTIPETITNWTRIEYASFDGNNFTGSLPEGLCDFISGDDILRADCGFPCRCCTLCF